MKLLFITDVKILLTYDFIARSIVYEVERQKEIGTPVTHVFVMWSGPTRHEIMADTNIFKNLKI